MSMYKSIFDEAKISTYQSTMTAQRKYQVFPGKNKILCDGRIIMARQMGIFYLTLFLIIVTSILFFAFDGRLLANEYNVMIPISGGILFLFVMASLLKTSFSDPGIIPRADRDEAEYTEFLVNIEAGYNPDNVHRPPPRQKEVIINGTAYRLKYCFTCKIFRPPRSSHCSVCDNCVERFDHHCPWVGNCIGKRNYRYFYTFVATLSVYCVYIFGCVIAQMVISSKKKGFLDSVKESPASILEGIICFFSIWSIIGLCGFHTYLVATNQTTNEDIKGTFSTKRNNNVKNPFSRKSAFHNFCAVICGASPPSTLDLRGIHIPTESRDQLPAHSYEYNFGLNLTHPANSLGVMAPNGSISPETGQPTYPYPKQINYDSAKIHSTTNDVLHSSPGGNHQNTTKLPLNQGNSKEDIRLSLPRNTYN